MTLQTRKGGIRRSTRKTKTVKCPLCGRPQEIFEGQSAYCNNPIHATKGPLMK